MNVRTSGILVHPTCFPGPFGIGDLGPSAYRFVDFLADSAQHAWQILPLNPTSGAAGHSPYHSSSTYAGNPLLISPELLVQEGWLQPAEVKSPPAFDARQVAFRKVQAYKTRLLKKACARFQHPGRQADDLAAFALAHPWLEDYALFAALDAHFGGRPWYQWPAGLARRKPVELAAARRELADQVQHHKAVQYLFFRQWQALKAYCGRRQVQIIGDMPIYMPAHSADVWARADAFQLSADLKPAKLSGVPPDYFSRTGQLWGHPLYDWEALRRKGYDWWVERTAHHLKLFDRVRIDHFRGLVAYWEVAAGAKNAIKGRWVPGPGADLLTRLARQMTPLPLLAEDLGTIDAQVRETMQQFDLPGMRVVLFAFGDDFPNGAFLPHNHVPNCLAYTGTHDNNTARGWFENEAGPDERRRLFSYLGHAVKPAALPWELIRLVMQSVARTVLFPLQDLLALGGEARMNRPAKRSGNWSWRVAEADFSSALAARLREMTETYGRG